VTPLIPPAVAGPAQVPLTRWDERCAAVLAGITEQVEHVVAAVAALGEKAAAIAAAARLGGRPLRRADLAALRPGVAGVLREHADLAVGAGVVLAPGALADAPMCIEWWWADQCSGLAQLHVDLDPESAEFYDYTTTEWYRVPERTGRPAVAGPYVDYICTHQYTFTVSVPVIAEGRFTGVAGADILAAQVERLALPGLSGLGRPAVLVSGTGRVIASNTPDVLPGIPAQRQPACADLLPAAGHGTRSAASTGSPAAASLPWTLLTRPA
jgi:Cache domain